LIGHGVPGELAVPLNSGECGFYILPQKPHRGSQRIYIDERSLWLGGTK